EDPKSIPILLDLLNDSDPRVAESAFNAMKALILSGQASGPGVVSAVEPQSKHPDEFVRAAAISCLVALDRGKYLSLAENSILTDPRVRFEVLSFLAKV